MQREDFGGQDSDTLVWGERLGRQTDERKGQSGEK